jgi:precorrin-6B methylase 2
MPLSALTAPQLDPTPIFEHLRSSFATEFMTAAVVHFQVFERVGERALTLHELAAELELAERPAVVLTTGLRAMGLLEADSAGRLRSTSLAREHLRLDSPFDISAYVGLVGENPGVLELVRRLKANRPAGAEPERQGADFIFREGLKSAMDEAASARRLTLALAGRAKNVAPSVAQAVDLSGARLLLDVGGGTGIYSIALLQKHPHLRAIVLDHPLVLDVAREMAEAYGVTDRLECRPGDMFRDALPAADAVLLSNVLHDWDVLECRALICRCAQALQPRGRLIINEAFLNDALDGPLAMALYSAQLFCLTEGRVYSAAEYRGWLSEAGLTTGEVIPTLIRHCGVLTAIKSTA